MQPPPIAPGGVGRPPREGINKMSDKFAKFMNAGGPPPPEPAKPAPAPEPTPAPAKAEPAPAPVAAKADAPKGIVPEPARAPAKAEPKATDQPKKIPHENFAALEEKARKYETLAKEAEVQAAELRQKLETMPKVDTAKIAETEKKLAEYETIVNQFYLEHSPRFRAAYDEKIGGLMEKAKRVVTGEQAASLEVILKLPEGEYRDKRFKELAVSLEDDFDRSRVAKLYDDLSEIQAERSRELAKAPENVKKLHEFEAEQTAKANEKRQLLRVDALNKTLQQFETVVPEFRVVAGEKEHNALVEENIGMAKSFLSPTLSDDDMARMAAYAVKGYRAIQADGAKDQLIATLQNQLAEFQAAGPTTGGGKGEAGRGKGAAGKTPAEKYREAMERGIPGKE